MPVNKNFIEADVCPISRRLREERLELGLTQEKLGVIGGVAVRAQRNYENAVSVPDCLYLARIDRIGADIHYIITGHRRPVLQEIVEPSAAAVATLDVDLLTEIVDVIERLRRETRFSNLSSGAVAKALSVIYRNYKIRSEYRSISEADVASILELLIDF